MSIQFIAGWKQILFLSFNLLELNPSEGYLKN